MGGLIFLLACIFRAIAYFLLRGQKKRKEAYSAHVTGIVAEVECRRVGSYHTKNYFPVVEYQAGEELLRGASTFGVSDERFFYVGQPVELDYDPKQCEKFRIPALEKEFEKAANIFKLVSYVMAGVCVVVCVIVSLTGGE